MAKCLNCGKLIEEGSEFCKTECFTEYYLYVFGKDPKDNPEFERKIDDSGELSEVAVANVLRNNQIFKNRTWKFSNFTKEGKFEIVDEVKVPDEQIVCDWCNSLISTFVIHLIILFKRPINLNSNVIVDKAVCHKCRKKYYDKVPNYNTIRCTFCKGKIKDFDNEKSFKEFLISGLCQFCQDKVFGDL